MKYSADRTAIELGDFVIVEGDVRGRVVCDFDLRQSVEGYESWLTNEELLGGGKLSTGIMVETKDLGLIHYADEDVDIVRDSVAS